MSSSTSSSETGRRLGPGVEPRLHEGPKVAAAPALPRRARLRRIALSLALVLLAVEAVNRAILLPQSKDYRRFVAYPGQAAELVAQPGLRLAFVGNSATECGVEPGIVDKELAPSAKQPVHADRFLADASEIHTWYYMTNSYFWRPGRRPDWVIIHYFNRMLDDAQPLEIGRLAYVFTETADWPQVLTHDITTLSGRVEFLLSTHWSTFATRDRIKARVLKAIVPDYEDYLEEANEQQLRLERRGAPPPQRYDTLDRFLAQARAHDMKVCFVAFPTMPTPSGAPAYQLDDAAVRRIRAAGMKLLDLRRVPGLTRAHYRDDIHLLPAGAEIYTRHFVQAFGALLAVE